MRSGCKAKEVCPFKARLEISQGIWLTMVLVVSGLLALSVERNNHMKMWNLTKGRCSFQTKLPTEASIVKFFPQAGESYAIVMGVKLEIRNAETGTTIHSLHHENKVFCIAQHEVPFISHHSVLSNPDSNVKWPSLPCVMVLKAWWHNKCIDLPAHRKYCLAVYCIAEQEVPFCVVNSGVKCQMPFIALREGLKWIMNS